MVSCFKEFRTKLYTALALGCLLCGVTLAHNVQTGYLPGSSSKVRQTNVDKAAKKLLANFPPG